MGATLQIPLDSVFPVSVEAVENHGFDLVGSFTVAAPIAGLLLAGLLYLTDTFSTQRLASIAWVNGLQKFWFSGWGVDWLYDHLWVYPFKFLAQINKNDAVDLGYEMVAKLSRDLHHLVSASQTGQVRWYAASMGFGAATIIAIGLLS